VPRARIYDLVPACELPYGPAASSLHHQRPDRWQHPTTCQLLQKPLASCWASTDEYTEAFSNTKPRPRQCPLRAKRDSTVRDELFCVNSLEIPNFWENCDEVLLARLPGRHRPGGSRGRGSKRGAGACPTGLCNDGRAALTLAHDRFGTLFPDQALAWCVERPRPRVQSTPLQ
jgi:hypothetical protein